MLTHHCRDSRVGGGAVFAVVVPSSGCDRDAWPSDRSSPLTYSNPPPLWPNGWNPSSQLWVTASHNKRCHPHIPYPGRPPPLRQLSSAISSLVVVIITISLFIWGDFCLSIYGKVAVSQKYWLQVVVFTLPLEDWRGRIRKVSSMPVWGRSVITRPQEGRFMIPYDRAERGGEFGGGGECTCEGVAFIWNILYAMSTFANL